MFAQETIRGHVNFGLRGILTTNLVGVGKISKLYHGHDMWWLHLKYVSWPNKPVAKGGHPATSPPLMLVRRCVHNITKPFSGQLCCIHSAGAPPPRSILQRAQRAWEGSCRDASRVHETYLAREPYKNVHGMRIFKKQNSIFLQ